MESEPDSDTYASCVDSGTASHPGPTGISLPGIDHKQLENVRHAVRYALRTEAGLPASAPDLSGADETFVQAARRHRVEICIEPHLDAMGVPDDAKRVIKARAHQQQLGAMRASMTLTEVAKTLDSCGLRYLVIKGIPLAVQTTGSLTARGTGDIDLLVHPDDLIEVITVLSGLGYHRIPGLGPMEPKGAAWRYFRWVYVELPLRRGSDVIDLHWRPTGERSVLPGFDTLWRQRIRLDIGPFSIPTLGPSDAFEHSCAHALKDEWKTIRSLVDVDRLARIVPVNGPSAPPRSTVVGLTSRVTFDLSGSPVMGEWATNSATKSRRALDIARRAQTKEITPPVYDWSPSGVWHLMSSMRMRTADTSDRVRYVIACALPPRVFNDPATGEDIPIRSGIAARFREVGPKIRRTYGR
jgi:hypothetical protein